MATEPKLARCQHCDHAIYWIAKGVYAHVGTLTLSCEDGKHDAAPTPPRKRARSSG